VSIESDKITFFSKIIYEKIDEENRNLSEAFLADREKQVGQLEKELEARRAKELGQAWKEALFKANEVTAREKSESRKQVMVLRESLIQKTMEDLAARFRSFAESDEYGDFLKELALRTVKTLESGSYIIYLTEADLKMHGEEVKAAAAARHDCSFELKAAASPIIGGLIVEEGGRRFMLDSGFSTVIEDARQKAGLKVSEILG